MATSRLPLTPLLLRLRRDDLDLHRRYAARLQCQRSQRHPVAERQRRAGALADERLDGGVQQPRRPVQSGAELARQGQRRLQRRRQVRHPVAERRWHARDLADERHATRCPTAPPARSIRGRTWQIKATGDFNGDGKSDILWQGERRHAGDLADERLDRAVQQPRRLVQSGTDLADQGHRRLQRRRQVRHPVAERRWHARDLADERLDRAVQQRRRSRSIRGPPGTSRPPATSTATASPTSCGRTTTAHPRSG